MYKVLIVDDEPFILDGLESMINWEEIGLEVAGKALDGAEAIKLLEDININIVITDIKMSNLSGIDLIKQTKGIRSNIKFIILSGYNDFEYVKEAVKLGIENYLLKPVNKEELKSTLMNTVDKIEIELYKEIHQRADMSILKQNILYRWVTDNISYDELSEKSSFINIDLNCESFYVGMVKVLYNNSTLKSNDDTSAMHFAVFNICNKLISERNMGISFCDLNGFIVLVFMVDNAGKKLIGDVLTECIKNINTFLKLDVFITLGIMQTECDNIHLSYNSAKRLQDYYLVSTPNSIIKHEEVIKSAENISDTVKIDYPALSIILASRKMEGIPNFIEGIFDQFMQNSAVSRHFVQYIAMEILFYINNYIKENKSGSIIRFESTKGLFESIFDLKMLKEVKQWLQAVLNTTIEFLIAEDENTPPLIKQVLHYININYSKDISMKGLADTFNINAAYLGQLLKKETGELFSDYLNKTRVEKAKELLLTTDLKASKIAEKTGYSDDNYFFKAFKKISGITPMEFRNREKQTP